MENRTPYIRTWQDGAMEKCMIFLAGPRHTEKPLLAKSFPVLLQIVFIATCRKKRRLPYHTEWGLEDTYRSCISVAFYFTYNTSTTGGFETLIVVCTHIF